MILYIYKYIKKILISFIHSEVLETTVLHDTIFQDYHCTSTFMSVAI